MIITIVSGEKKKLADLVYHRQPVSNLTFKGPFMQTPVNLVITCISSGQFNREQSNVTFIQICFGITHGRVLNGELYAQRLRKLIYL